MEMHSAHVAADVASELVATNITFASVDVDVTSMSVAANVTSESVAVDISPASTTNQCCTIALVGWARSGLVRSDLT